MLMAGVVAGTCLSAACFWLVKVVTMGGDLAATSETPNLYDNLLSAPHKPVEAFNLKQHGKRQWVPRGCGRWKKKNEVLKRRIVFRERKLVRLGASGVPKFPLPPSMISEGGQVVDGLGSEGPVHFEPRNAPPSCVGGKT